MKANKLKIGALVGLVLAGSSGCAHQIADMMREQEERAEYRRMYGYPQEQRGPSDGDVMQRLGLFGWVAGENRGVPGVAGLGSEMMREGRRMNREERRGNFYQQENQLRHYDGPTNEGQWYSGDMFGNAPHGDGYVTYPDGSTFSGSFNYGKRHGWGVAIFRDKSQLHGLWNNGVLSGRVLIINPDGRRIEKEFHPRQ